MRTIFQSNGSTSTRPLELGKIAIRADPRADPRFPVQNSALADMIMAAAAQPGRLLIASDLDLAIFQFLFAVSLQRNH